MKRLITVIFGVSLIMRFAACHPQASRRIQKEIKDLEKQPVIGMSAIPRQNNINHFDVKLAGPKDSPYEGGVFELEVILPEEYPIKPPKVRFVTKIYHPNINAHGEICVDILQKNWTPILGVRSTLISIQSLLYDPFQGQVDHIQTAKEWTRQYAMGSSSQSQPSSEPQPSPRLQFSPPEQQLHVSPPPPFLSEQPSPRR